MFFISPDDNAASARQPTLISGNLEDSDEEDDEDGNRKMKPKHIRWQLEDGKEETSGKIAFPPKKPCYSFKATFDSRHMYVISCLVSFIHNSFFLFSSVS